MHTLLLIEIVNHRRVFAGEGFEALFASGIWDATGIENESAEVGMIPKNLVKVEGKNAAAMIRLSEFLEEHDDVQNVYSNFDVDEKELEAIA